MPSLRQMAETRPVLFVVALALAQGVLALPFVVLFKALGLGIVPLRLIIPVAETALMLAVVSRLGWWRRSGLATAELRALPVLWFPAVLAFVPWLYAGSSAVPAGALAFYLAALVFTGLGEEIFARGLVLPALLAHGRWWALLGSAALFSAGHITNLFFEDFSALDWLDKFSATFAFAVLYGAVFLRTGNLWPLVFLHILHDFAYLTSGMAGPFARGAIPLPLGLALSAAATAYGLWSVRKADPKT
ncbi:MAG: CPBP family intramembrane metalloprotease [Rhodobacteraceae bacterium]|nr:CPBP family intramembrane metalloprotease [Paracoccaceae bacterium]